MSESGNEGANAHQPLRHVNMTMFSHWYGGLTRSNVESIVMQWMGSWTPSPVLTDTCDVVAAHNRVPEIRAGRPYAAWQQEMKKVAYALGPNRLVLTGHAPPTAWAYFGFLRQRFSPPLIVRRALTGDYEVFDLEGDSMWNGVLRPLRRAWYGRRVFDVHRLCFGDQEPSTSSADNGETVTAFHVTCNGRDRMSPADYMVIRNFVESEGHQMGNVYDIRPTSQRLTDDPVHGSSVYIVHEADLPDIRRELTDAVRGLVPRKTRGVALVSSAPAPINWIFGTNIHYGALTGPMWTFERLPGDHEETEKRGTLELAFSTERDRQ